MKDNARNAGIAVLSIDQISAVSGGRMNNGTGHLYAKPGSTAGGGGNILDALAKGLIVTAIALGGTLIVASNV